MKRFLVIMLALLSTFCIEDDNSVNLTTTVSSELASEIDYEDSVPTLDSNRIVIENSNPSESTSIVTNDSTELSSALNLIYSGDLRG